MRRNWSIDKRHWESLPDDFLNGNWRKVNYISSESIRVSKKGGIYMYCVSIPKAKGDRIANIRTPIYMGISNDLRRRFTEHLDKEEIRDMSACFGNKLSFLYLVISPFIEKEVKIKYEQPMIDCFGKVVNKINSSVKIEPEDVKLDLNKFKPI